MFTTLLYLVDCVCEDLIISPEKSRYHESVKKKENLAFSMCIESYFYAMPSSFSPSKLQMYGVIRVANFFEVQLRFTKRNAIAIT